MSLGISGPVPVPSRTWGPLPPGVPALGGVFVRFRRANGRNDSRRAPLGTSNDITRGVMTNPEQYQERAAECLRALELAQSPSERLKLLAMSRYYQRLVEHAREQQDWAGGTIQFQ